MLNSFQTVVPETGDDGFMYVKRAGNPKRKYGLVHRDLGKIGAVSPQAIQALAAQLLKCKPDLGPNPVIIGLSESSILLGRAIAELYPESSFLFSTRYPTEAAAWVAFSETHSHAPNQYLCLDNLQKCTQICIVEDEITTGQTLLNLIRVLLTHLPEVERIQVLALKLLCPPERLKKLEQEVQKWGPSFSLAGLYLEPASDFALQSPNSAGPTDVQLNLNPFEEAVFLPNIEKSPTSSAPAPWEQNRGRLFPLLGTSAQQRYIGWSLLVEEVRKKIPISPEPLTIIGASEAVDLAYEITLAHQQVGYTTRLRHLTLSPWELAGWHLRAKSFNAKDLHLYLPPGSGGNYILVYDQTIQQEQIKTLANYLHHLGATTFIVQEKHYKEKHYAEKP